MRPILGNKKIRYFRGSTYIYIYFFDFDLQFFLGGVIKLSIFGEIQECNLMMGILSHLPLGPGGW